MFARPLTETRKVTSIHIGSTSFALAGLQTPANSTARNAKTSVRVACAHYPHDSVQSRRHGCIGRSAARYRTDRFCSTRYCTLTLRLAAMPARSRDDTIAS